MVGRGKQMSPGEVAARLDVSAATVRRWEDSGELMPVQRLPSGYRRYDPDDVGRLAAVLAMPGGPQRDEAIQSLRVANLKRRDEPGGRG